MSDRTIRITTRHLKSGRWSAVARFKDAAEEFSTEARIQANTERGASAYVHKQVLDLLRLLDRWPDVVDREEQVNV